MSKGPLLGLLIGFLAFGQSAIAQHAALRIIPLKSGVTASLRGIAARNSQEAWATGSDGTVIRTTDGGRNWQRIHVPDADELDFRDVELLASQTVLLMSVGNGNASRIFRSHDNGKTWKTVLVNLDPKGFFDGLTFDSTGKNGVLFGDPIDGRMDLYRSGDAGATWRRVAAGQCPILQKGEYGFAASGTGVVMSGKNIWIATGGTVARVHHSADDGKTWIAHVTPIRSGNESSGIFSIAIADSKTAVVVGGDYLRPKLDQNNVARSLDGGKTWITLPAAGMPHKACVQSLGGNKFVTCGRTGVAVSNDNGKTWTSLTTDSYYTLAVDRRTGTGFLAGAGGHIARFE